MRGFSCIVVRMETITTYCSTHKDFESARLHTIGNTLEIDFACGAHEEHEMDVK